MPDSSVPARRNQTSTNGHSRPTAADLRRDLDIAEARVREHLAGLRSEITLADIRIGRMPLVSHIRRRPLAVSAVTLGTFALGTFLYTLSRRTRPLPDTREQWWEVYLEDLLDDAALRVTRGGDSEQALQKALRQRAPVIVIEGNVEQKAPGQRKAWVAAVTSVVNTVVGFGMKFALDRLSDEITAQTQAGAAHPGRNSPANHP